MATIARHDQQTRTALSASSHGLRYAVPLSVVMWVGFLAAVGVIR